ncbi:uncharacterized protein LOC110717469 [Chenopodium quinoa]|uniref:uncharacterized protein LOC110717469 n=1 Tax=Chenopodium quinoa TaxID=63459 RepID=UPI000B77DBBF|nr:uncharacterized protein LOC110717469 [Chenopodium quinoa]
MDNQLVPSTSKANSQTIQISWSPPHHGVVKINFDGSVRGTSGAGVVIRDHLGNHICSRSFNIDTSTPLIAEATTLRNGLLFARSHTFSHIFIEGDNLLIINILQGKTQCPWKIQLLLEDIRELLRLSLPSNPGTSIERAI